jgi:hypothetical protein
MLRMIIDTIDLYIVMLAPLITATNSHHLSPSNLGTGNVLFQIASTYGLAKLYSRKVDFSYVRAYCDKIHTLFGYDHGKTLYRHCNAVPTVYSITVGEDDYCEKALAKNTLKTIVDNPNSNILLSGYFEYPPYFNACRTDILNMFAPDAESQAYIDSNYPELKTETVIALHIRVGKDANVRCSMDYYIRAVAYMNERVSNPLYFVFSDEPVDVSQFGVRVRYIKTTRDYIDLWTMSQCHHIITTYSTFSWWGAYLNTHHNKIVTYPLSALRYIQTRNRQSESDIHSDFFLNAVKIVDIN